MAKVIDYAYLSKDIYDFKFSIAGNLSQKGWKNINDVYRYFSSMNGFFAKLYVFPKDGVAKEAVIVFRGSENFDNFTTDIKAWNSDVLGDGSSDKIPDTFFQAKNFYFLARTFLRIHHPKAKLSLTGHSLGGALAQLLVALDNNYFNSVVFNSPGVGNMPGINFDMAEKIHNINSRYGFINKIGNAIGSIDYVDVTEGGHDAKIVLETLALENNEYDKFIGKNKFLWLKKAIFATNPKIIKAKLLTTIYPQHKIENLIEAIQRDSSLAERVYV